MAVLRKVKKTDYTVIDNNIFKNKKLSLKGKGMICTMLSLPDNWEFSEDGLTSLSNDGKASIRSTLKELMEFGYLVRTRNRDEKGILRDYVYTIYEEPTLENQKQVEEPTCDYPTLEKPTLENRNTYKILKDKVLNNKYNTTTNSIYDFLQENGFVLAPIHYEVISKWEDNELTRHAIKQAVLNNKYNINYVDKIIYSYQKNNIKTIQQAVEREEEFNQKRDTYYKKKYEVKESRYEREQRILKEMIEDDENGS